LEAGVDYCCAIENFRVRVATVLPALIGARTLALLRDAGPVALSHRVKMLRGEVRNIIISTIAKRASPPSLRKAFQDLFASHKK
jgi:farnesyl-diphosphate farnesyltransferase